MHGQCPRGDFCHFAHGITELRQEDTAMISALVGANVPVIPLQKNGVLAPGEAVVSNLSKVTPSPTHSPLLDLHLLRFTQSHVPHAGALRCNARGGARLLRAEAVVRTTTSARCHAHHFYADITAGLPNIISCSQPTLLCRMLSLQP
eukprot:1160543-Prorocentrum_minimum.AAC.3